MIELMNCSVQFGDFIALKKVSIKIEKGEKVGIIGSSGAGKSTLLREIYKEIKPAPSLIHQHLALVPQLSVFHNVFIGQLDQHAAVQNLVNLVYPRSMYKEPILALLKQLGIGDKLMSPVSLLSGGEQQRVAIARALYRESRYLLGDEPVASIDPYNSDIALELMTTLNRTVVLTLHKVDLALRHCTRIIGLSKGEVVLDATSNDLKESDLLSLYNSC